MYALCQTYLKEKPCPSCTGDMDSPKAMWCKLSGFHSVEGGDEWKPTHTRRDGDLFLAMLLLVLRHCCDATAGYKAGLDKDNLDDQHTSQPI
jgi:hypothetical protein